MSVVKYVFALFCLLVIFVLNSDAKTGRIYGVVQTGDDETFEGWIRWDKHETFWDDYLDGTKKYYLRSDLNEKLILKIYGPYNVYRSTRDFRTNSTIAIQFGHISKIIKSNAARKNQRATQSQPLPCHHHTPAAAHRLAQQFNSRPQRGGGYTQGIGSPTDQAVINSGGTSAITA